jgi:hypothetical protein
MHGDSPEFGDATVAAASRADIAEHHSQITSL